MGRSHPSLNSHPHGLTKFVPRKHKRDFGLISDALPFGRLWYPKSRTQSATRSFTADHMTLRLGLFDGSGNVINTYEQAGKFKEP
jgi:hypothetical protein